MKRPLYYLFFVLLSFIAFPLYAQTGPGGIGKTDGTSDLTLWLDANSIPSTNSQISTWQDRSGWKNNATVSGTSSPKFNLTTINGYPKVQFSKNQSLAVTDHNSLKPETISIFVVGNLKKNSGNWGAFISKTSGTSWPDGYGLTRNDNNSSVIGFVGKWQSTNVTNDIIYDRNQILTLNFTGPTLDLYKNENKVAITKLSSSQVIYHRNSTLYLGWAEGNNNYLDGDIAEAIILKRHVNEAERIIINNYLSAKYNIQLDVADNDLYKQDNVENGNFDHHVAGIGKTTGSDSHTDSQGTGIVRINKASNLQNNSFLFWGEDSKNSSYNFSTNYSGQLSSTWRVSKKGTIGIVDVSFDTAAAKMTLPEVNSCAGWQLIVSSNSEFENPRVYPLVFSGSFATATGVIFGDGDYFTIRNVNQIVWDGKRYFNGSGHYHAPSINDKCFKLLIKGGNKAKLDQNTSVREIEIENGAHLELASGVNLTVTNNLVNNGIIDLQGEAQLIQNHKGANSNKGTGKLKIRQQGTTNPYNYNYWSSPVNRGGSWQIGFLEQDLGPVLFHADHNGNQKTNPVTLSSRWLYNFNAASSLGINGWNRIKVDTNIPPGIGYTLKGSGSKTTGTQLPEVEYVFSGEANSGGYSYEVNPGNDFLVGNPYPSALSAQQFIKDNKDITTATLYFYEQFDNNNTHIWRNYQGGYATLNLLTSVAAAATSQLNNGGNSTKGPPTNNIAVGQGFFVSIVKSGPIKFNNGQRVFAKESNKESVFYRGELSNANADTRTKFWLNFTDPTGRAREIALGYDENASKGFDKGYDAIDYSDYPDTMLWDAADNLLVIQGLKEFNIEDEMSLFIKITTAGTYTVSLNNTLNFPEDTPIYLNDKHTSSFYDLRTEEASLKLDAGVFTDRFSITYQNKTLGLPGMNESSSVNVKYDKSSESVQILGIENLTSIRAVSIYAMDGKRIQSIKNLESTTLDISQLYDGVYILKMVMTSGGSKNIRFLKY